MDALRLWIFRMLCATLCCAVVTSLPLQESRKKIFRFLCGIFLTIVLLSGLPGVNLPELAKEILPDLSQLPAPAASGEEMSMDAIRQLIIQETEAYILHKAADIGVDIRVDVILSAGEFPVPESVVIQGTCADEQKALLSAMMAEELGVPEEEQRWMG